jgi:hypothetical protein
MEKTSTSTSKHHLFISGEFIKLLNSCDKTELIKLSQLIKNALALRNLVLTLER